MPAAAFQAALPSTFNCLSVFAACRHVGRTLRGMPSGPGRGFKITHIAIDDPGYAIRSRPRSASFLQRRLGTLSGRSPMATIRPGGRQKSHAPSGLACND